MATERDGRTKALVLQLKSQVQSLKKRFKQLPEPISNPPVQQQRPSSTIQDFDSWKTAHRIWSPNKAVRKPPMNMRSPANSHGFEVMHERALFEP